SLNRRKRNIVSLRLIMKVLHVLAAFWYMTGWEPLHQPHARLHSRAEQYDYHRTYAVGVLAGAAGRREPSFSTHLWRQSRCRWVEKERGSLEGKALQTSQPPIASAGKPARPRCYTVPARGSRQRRLHPAGRCAASTLPCLTFWRTIITLISSSYRSAAARRLCHTDPSWFVIEMTRRDGRM